MLPEENIKTDSFDMVDDNTYLLREDVECGMVYLTGLDGLLQNGDVQNVYLDWELPWMQDVPYAVSGTITIAPYLRDEGNDQYVELEDHIMRPDNEASKYLWFQGAGKIRTIVLRTGLSETGAIKINRIIVNAHRPIQFSAIRCLVIFLLGMALCGMWKASSWELTETESQKKERLIIALVGVALILPAIYINHENAYLKGDITFRPYQQLTEAFIAGQPRLLEEPSDALKQLDNPYDYTARDAAGLVKNVDYLWDTAYYEGHYYVYFGVLPCILFYLPYRLLTGMHLQDSIVILICAFFLYAGIGKLVRAWCAGRKQKVPYVQQVMAVVTLFMGSNVMACMGAPDAHDVPRMCGLAFLVWGVYFWMAAGPEEEAEDQSYSLLRLAVGSFCMALAVGCRPNLAFYSFLAPVLFLRERKIFGGAKGKEAAAYFSALLLPYLPVAFGLMYYNAIRFGSIFDFGYVYNLTVHDYNYTVFSFDKLVIALHYFLVKFPQLDYVFPYLRQEAFSEVDRLGHTDFYLTHSYGGLLICNPILWSIPFLFAARNRKSRNGRIAIALLILALGQIFINMMTGGVSYNYMADFALPLLLAGWEGAFERWNTFCDGTGKAVYKKYLVGAFIWSFAFYANFYFAGSLVKGNTELYYRIFYAFNFF